MHLVCQVNHLHPMLLQSPEHLQFLRLPWGQEVPWTPTNQKDQPGRSFLFLLLVREFQTHQSRPGIPYRPQTRVSQLVQYHQVFQVNLLLLLLQPTAVPRRELRQNPGAQGHRQDLECQENLGFRLFQMVL